MQSDNVAIRVNHISKIYPLYNSTRDRLKEALHPLRKKYHKDFYALNDVSFEIKKGDTVGIIGQNGSGKSTLLSIIAGVLTATSGTIEVKGKVSSLLELGTGFNPELTGIQNIFFYGTLLGFTKEEMDSKIDDILSFADIGDFVNQPVKTYSSGMYVRLAFAAAIAIDPEVLIVDEALSVGDEKFQRKCFSRIEVLKKKGVTILFVSHSASAVVTLCDKAILFDEGELILEGIPKIIIGKYLRLLYAPSQSRKLIRKEIQETIVLNQEIIKEEYTELNNAFFASDFKIPIFDELERDKLKDSVSKLTWDTSYKLFNEVFSDNSRYMTVHQAKGLEWEKVIVSVTPNSFDKTNLAGLYANPKLVEENPADEFARMYYVACSRAKEDLYIHII